MSEPSAGDSDEIRCWHKECDESGICKTCGAKARVTIEGMPEGWPKSVDMSCVQGEVTQVSGPSPELLAFFREHPGINGSDLRDLAEFVHAREQAAVREYSKHFCQCEEPYFGAQPIGICKCERCGKCFDRAIRTLAQPAAEGGET